MYKVCLLFVCPLFPVPATEVAATTTTPPRSRRISSHFFLPFFPRNFQQPYFPPLPPWRPPLCECNGPPKVYSSRLASCWHPAKSRLVTAWRFLRISSIPSKKAQVSFHVLVRHKRDTHPYFVPAFGTSLRLFPWWGFGGPFFAGNSTYRY